MKTTVNVFLFILSCSLGTAANADIIFHDHNCYCVYGSQIPCDENAIHAAEPANGCTNASAAAQQSSVPYYCSEDPVGPTWLEMDCSLTGCLINGILSGGAGKDPCGVTKVCETTAQGWYPYVIVNLGDSGTAGSFSCDYPGSTNDTGGFCSSTGTIYWSH